jgi:hypothetical protein
MTKITPFFQIRMKNGTVPLAMPVGFERSVEGPQDMYIFGTFS